MGSFIVFCFRCHTTIASAEEHDGAIHHDADTRIIPAHAVQQKRWQRLNVTTKNRNHKMKNRWPIEEENRRMMGAFLCAFVRDGGFNYIIQTVNCFNWANIYPELEHSLAHTSQHFVLVFHVCFIIVAQQQWSHTVLCVCSNVHVYAHTTHTHKLFLSLCCANNKSSFMLGIYLF